MSVLKYKYLSLMFIPPPTLYHRGLRLLKVKPTPVVANNPEHLRSLVTEQIRRYGEECDLNHIDVSHIDDMSGIFSRLPFNGDISEWNVSKVVLMTSMFRGSDFNRNIEQWDVSNVKDMRCMFEGSTYERDISAWKISPQCNIQDAAPKYYGESPLFLACALADGQVERPRGIQSSRYEEAYAMMETLGAKGIEAGYAMFQIMRGQPGLVTVPTCELTDFS